MTPEELDQWRGREARRLRREYPEEATEVIAARLAREGRTPPPAVDPYILAFREWASNKSPNGARMYRSGVHDTGYVAQCFLAGARTATRRELERAALLARCMRQEAARLRELSTINDFDETVSDGGITAGMVCRQEIAQIAQSLNDALAKYNGEA